MLKKQKNKWVLVKRTKLAFSYPCILESVGMEEETSFYIPAASKQTRRAKTNPPGQNKPAKPKNKLRAPLNHAIFYICRKTKRGMNMTIGIIGAMEEEVAVLKNSMDVEKVVEYASMEFYKGVLCGKNVVVVRSGIGKVNAAICTQILADKFKVDVLINTGIAGSLDAAIDIGDMVISTDLVEHDMDASIFGDPIGQVPRMDTFSFPADSELVKKAVLANKEANPDIKTFTGRIVSGDQFVSSAEVKERLVELFQAKCTEMEGAAIAHAAYLNKISCVIIRAISDKADNSATMDYPTFEKQAIKHSVKLVRNLLLLL